METVSWLKLGPDPYIAHCERCGALIPCPELPALIDEVVRFLRTAEEEHANCKEK